LRNLGKEFVAMTENKILKVTTKMRENIC